MIKRRAFTALFLFIPLLLLAELSVHFIDVGQGDSILLVSDEAVVLVDAGQYGEAATYLSGIGIQEIDLIIATHAHADHVGGIPAVMNAIPVNRVWYNGQTHTTLTFERFIDSVLDSDAVYHEPSRGDRLSLGDLTITVLHPDSSAADSDGHLHDKNIVVRADYHDFSILLTGDAETDAEEEMIQSGMNLSSTVLKLGHHGSRTSSSISFLDAVSPEIVVYQAGSDNRYGHPHEEVIVRVQTVLNADLYGTDIHGTIVVVTDGEKYEVFSDRGNDDLILFECVDINTASVSELMRIIHIGESRAQELIERRPYNTLDQLVRIRGIGDARLGDILEQGLVCPID